MRTDTATPNHLILQPIQQIDPRVGLGETALIEASRNGFPIVANRTRRGDSTGLLAGGGIALLLGGLTFWSMSGHRAPLPLARHAPVAERTPVFVAPPRYVAPSPTRSFAAVPVPPTIAPQLTLQGATAPVMVFDGSTPPAPAIAGPATARQAGTANAKSPGAAGGNDNDQFARRVGDGDVEVANAQQLSNPATTITQGTLIPAVLETAIDTDLPGYVRAVVSRDVRSFDGTQVLVPRSSRLIGQYKSGLAAGQTRAYVIWSRLIRPDGVSVALGSPAVDFSGNSGLAGQVDGHFLKRFGAAALLTVIGGLSAIGNSSVVLSGGQSAAGTALQGTGQIPPTIKIAQGQPIRVFTAKDLDFSTVGDDAPVAVATQP
jgi:type IV secretion system protein VirB10